MFQKRYAHIYCLKYYNMASKKANTEASEENKNVLTEQLKELLEKSNGPHLCWPP